MKNILIIIMVFCGTVQAQKIKSAGMWMNDDAFKGQPMVFGEDEAMQTVLASIEYSVRDDFNEKSPGPAAIPMRGPAFFNVGFGPRAFPKKVVSGWLVGPTPAFDFHLIFAGKASSVEASHEAGPADVVPVSVTAIVAGVLVQSHHHASHLRDTHVVFFVFASPVVQFEATFLPGHFQHTLNRLVRVPY